MLTTSWPVIGNPKIWEPNARDAPQNFSYPTSLDALLAQVKPLVVLVDMQLGFMKPFLNQTIPENLVKNQLRVIEACQKHYLPIAVLEYVACGETLDPLRRAIEEVPNHQYFKKGKNSGFTNDEFNTYVKRWVDQDIFLMGVNASACVKETASDALERKYRITTAECVIGDNKGNPVFFQGARTWFRLNGTYIGENFS